MVYVGLGAATVGAGMLFASFALKRPKIGKKTRLLVVGDSLAVGLSPHFKSMSEERGIPFSSLAKVGTRIDQWASDVPLAERLRTFAPTVVLISLGTNDEYGKTGQQQAPHIATLIAKIKAAGAKPVWIGPPKLAKSNGVIEAIQAQIPSGDYFDSRLLEIPRAPDGLHPTGSGYARWAGLIWAWLTE